MTFFQAFAGIVLIICCLVTIVLYVRQEQRRYDARRSAKPASLPATTDTTEPVR